MLAAGAPMTQPLEYAPPSVREPSRLLGFGANATLVYPLVFLACLYGQWFLSWYVLGHVPRPSLDDPKYIDGASWMHPVTSVALMGLLPSAGAGLALNGLHVVLNRPGLPRTALRMLCLLGLWAGTVVLLRWDAKTYQVVEWWTD